MRSLHVPKKQREKTDQGVAEMSVYVDPLTDCLKSKIWPYDMSCHMFADTEEELHVMAATIGLKREWFQSKGRLKHYDLTVRKRLLAVKNGCIELTRREAVEMWKEI